MRDLDTYTAEVFSRSEKRIKARRKRIKWLLATGIPGALCVVAIFCIAPKLPQRGTEEILPMEPAAGVSESFSLYTSVIEITVAGNGYTSTFTDSKRVNAIYEEIGRYNQKKSEGMRNPEFPNMDDGLENGEKITTPSLTIETDDFNGIEGTQLSDDYIITLICSDGSRIEYRLSGNLLINPLNGENNFLSESDATRLKEMLEIPPQ